MQLSDFSPFLRKIAGENCTAFRLSDSPRARAPWCRYPQSQKPNPESSRPNPQTAAQLYKGDLGAPVSQRGDRHGTPQGRAKGQHWCPQAGRIAWPRNFDEVPGLRLYHASPGSWASPATVATLRNDLELGRSLASGTFPGPDSPPGPGAHGELPHAPPGGTPPALLGGIYPVRSFGASGSQHLGGGHRDLRSALPGPGPHHEVELNPVVSKSDPLGVGCIGGVSPYAPRNSKGARVQHACHVRPPMRTHTHAHRTTHVQAQASSAPRA